MKENNSIMINNDEKCSNTKSVLNENEESFPYIEYFDTNKKNYSKKIEEKIFSFISFSITKKEKVSNEILKYVEQFEEIKNFHESRNKVEIYFKNKFALFFRKMNFSF